MPQDFPERVESQTSYRDCPCSQRSKSRLQWMQLTRHQGRCPGNSSGQALQVLAPKGTIFSCPYCDHQAAGLTSFEGHILQVNLLDFRPTESPIDIESLTFENQAQFDCWRDDLNVTENAQYSLLSTRTFPTTGVVYKTFVCRRSSETAKPSKQYDLGDPTNKNSRPSRTKSTCKLDEACASRIIATIRSNGLISVRYIRLHLGHDPKDIEDLQHLRLSAFIRRKITMQLLEQIAEKTIVRSINQSLRSRDTREANILVS